MGASGGCPGKGIVVGDRVTYSSRAYASDMLTEDSAFYVEKAVGTPLRVVGMDVWWTRSGENKVM